MTGFFRRTTVIGSSLLILLGTLGPIAAHADTSTTGPAIDRPTGAVGPPSLTTSYPLAPKQFSLTISPTRLSIGPDQLGETQTFLVVNQGQAPAAVTVEKRNFTADIAGTMIYTPNAAWAAASWIATTPNKFVVEPGKTQIVSATVKVPAKPEPGDHQVALVFLVPAGQTSANIKINRGVSTPIFITVPGPTTTTTSLTSMVAPHFVSGGPVTISATVHNTGTVHRDFRGKTPLTVVAAGGSVNFSDFTVPRDTSRSVSTTWDPPFMCVCHATVSIQNAAGEVSSVSMQIIVFPWLFVLLMLLGTVAIVLAVLFARRRYRSTVARAAHRMAVAAGGSA